MCDGKNREKGWTGLGVFYVGTVPRTDRLGNGHYIYNEESPTDISLCVFEITDWNTRKVIHHGFGKTSLERGSLMLDSVDDG
ncbi:MAG: hypothetical protein WA915_09415, partial [Candidatus Aminicenantaceae bacterium]